MTHYVAIDIGGTNIKYGLIDQEGQLVESHEMPTEAHKGGPHILQKTKDIVASYLEKGPVAGVAISSAGWWILTRVRFSTLDRKSPTMQELSSRKKSRLPLKSLARLKMMSIVQVLLRQYLVQARGRVSLFA